jgi:CHAD domain-containing protein
VPIVNGVVKLLKTRLNHFAAGLDGLERGDVTALHRVRVASRRMRELIPVLQLPGNAGRKLNRRLRKVTRRLGTVRELDVLLLLIDELHVSRPVHQAALRLIRAEVAVARDAARKRLRSHLPIDTLRRLAKKLRRMVERLTDAQHGVPRKRGDRSGRDLRWAIDARVAQRSARLNEAMIAAGAVYLPERLHDVRIASKKLRYALELWERLRGERNTPPVRALKRVQALLGRMHDLQVLIERAREVQASLTPPSLSTWRELDELVVALEDMCRRLHARYVRERGALESLTRRAATSNLASRLRADQKAG